MEKWWKVEGYGGEAVTTWMSLPLCLLGECGEARVEVNG